MASVFAGIAQTLSGEKTEKSAHAVFVETQLIPAVQRLQKELGWRRYKVSLDRMIRSSSSPRLAVASCCVLSLASLSLTHTTLLCIKGMPNTSAGSCAAIESISAGRMASKR